METVELKKMRLWHVGVIFLAITLFGWMFQVRPNMVGVESCWACKNWVGPAYFDEANPMAGAAAAIRARTGP